MTREENNIVQRKFVSYWLEVSKGLTEFGPFFKRTLRSIAKAAFIAGYKEKNNAR